MADTTRGVIWTDFNGRNRLTLLRGNASLASVLASLVAVSNGDCLRCWEGPTQVNTLPVVTAADYQNVADYAQLVYTDGSGNLVYITLPAPQSGIFLADQETVDGPAIAGVTTAVVGTILTGAGNAVTAFVGGFRRRSGREYQ